MHDAHHIWVRAEKRDLALIKGDAYLRQEKYGERLGRLIKNEAARIRRRNARKVAAKS